MKIKTFEKKTSLARVEKCTFKNEYGEKFTLYFDGITVYFGGDETDNEVMLLLNPKFCIYSAEELNKIGKALVVLTGRW